jgi:hypothetical protein
MIVGKGYALGLSRWRRRSASDGRVCAALVFLFANLEEALQADFGSGLVALDGIVVMMVVFLAAKEACPFVGI